MFGIDGPELLLIAVVALIFIGPKELPGMLRTVGKWMATARGLAAEFRGHVDDMVRQSELDEVKKQIEDGTKDAVLDLQGLDPTKEIKSLVDQGAIDAEKELASVRSAIDEATAATEPPPAVTSAEFAPPATDAPVAIETAALVPPSSAEAEPVAIETAAVAPPSGTEAAPAGPVPLGAPLAVAALDAAKPVETERPPVAKAAVG
ncbi:MAG: twin-arginine translocase subunit TatB [Rhodospirillales bacterium]|nr:MAG: twin-arginine translocase subunit TatB [Rhodospirillales bacterium]